MSFGFSISDFALLINLSRQIYRDCKYAGREYADVKRELSSLQNVLKVLYEELESTDSPLANEDLKYASLLHETMNGCKDILARLKAHVDRHRALQDNSVRGPRRPWSRFRFGTLELERLDLLRRKLISYTSSLAVLLETFQLATTSRVERKVDGGFEHMREVLDHIVSAARGKHRIGSVLTLSTHPEDDKEVWREFRRELLLEGFGSQKLCQYKSGFKDYMKSLDRGAIPDARATPKQLVEGRTRAESSLVVRRPSVSATSLAGGIVKDVWRSDQADTSDEYDECGISDGTSTLDEYENELPTTPNYTLFPLGYPQLPQQQSARRTERKKVDQTRPRAPTHLTAHAQPIFKTLVNQPAVIYVMMMDMVIFNAKPKSVEDPRGHYFEAEYSQVAGLSRSRCTTLDDSKQFGVWTLETGMHIGEQDFDFMRVYEENQDLAIVQAESMFDLGKLDRLVAAADKVFVGSKLEGLTSWRITTPDLYVRLPAAGPYNPYNQMHPRLQTHQHPPYSQITFTSNQAQHPHAHILIHDYTIRNSGSVIVRRTNLADILRELTYCYLILIRGHTELNSASFNGEFADIARRVSGWFLPQRMIIDQRIRCIQSDPQDFPWSFLLIGSLG